METNLKFKVGDKVLVLSNRNGSNLEVGKIAIILDCSLGSYKAALADKLDRPWWFCEDQLELIEIKKELTGIENQLSILNDLDLNLNDFYVVTIRENSLSLQGSIGSELVRKLLRDERFKQSKSSNVYLEFECDYVTITLT